MKIQIKPIKDLRPSVHNFDPPFLHKGEVAHITRIIVADRSNPLYEVTNSQGKTQAIYRRQLVDVGALEAF